MAYFHHDHRMSLDPATINALIGVGGKVVDKVGGNKDVNWVYPQCGKKPILPFGKKRKAWENCVMVESEKDRQMNMLEIQSRSNQVQKNRLPENENFFQTNKNWIVPTAIGATVLIGILIYKNSQI